MGPAEITGLVVLIVGIFEGLIGLVKYLVHRNEERDDDDKQIRALKELAIIKEKVFRLDDRSPIQDKIIERLEKMSQIELKMLVMIERIERRIESFPG